MSKSSFGVWRIRVLTEEQAEVLAAELSDWGYDSFQLVEPVQNIGASGDQSTWVLEAYGRPSELRDGCREWLLTQYRDWVKGVEEPEVLEDINWNKEWESRFEPVQLGAMFGIRAPFHEPLNVTDLELVIMPRMSFGTGHHPTTLMMCWWLLGAPTPPNTQNLPVLTRRWDRADSPLSPRGLRVLDMGCGTGVLAILAYRLGADWVWGLDIEEGSASNAAENAERNAVQGLWEQGNAQNLALSGHGPMDLILANINRNILLEDMAAYAQNLREGGQLWLSGFYTEDTEILLERALTLGLEPLAEATLNRWATLLLVKTTQRARS